jgi:hypothetical protein
MADSGASAPAEATGEATQEALNEAPDAASTSAAPVRRWPLAGFVAGGAAISGVISIAVHVALVGTVLVLGSWGRPPAPDKPVPVDVVTEDQLDALEKTDPKPPDPPKPQTQIPDISSNPQQSQQPQGSKQSAQPGQAPSPHTQSGASEPPPPPPPPPPPSPQTLPSLDAFAPPLAPSDAPATSAPPPPAPAPSTGQAAQLAEMLGLPNPAAMSGGAPSDFKANLTAGEVAGFVSHIQSCWTPLPTSIRAGDLTFAFRVRLGRDGRLAGSPEPLGGSAVSPDDAKRFAQAKAIIQNAMKTLTTCSAYTALPADKYDEWHVLDLRFTPNGISVASPARAARPG